jgi:ATP-dependent Clp protease ATP-binding subunit ClpA
MLHSLLPAPVNTTVNLHITDVGLYTALQQQSQYVYDAGVAYAHATHALDVAKAKLKERTASLGLYYRAHPEHINATKVTDATVDAAVANTVEIHGLTAAVAEAQLLVNHVQALKDALVDRKKAMDLIVDAVKLGLINPNELAKPPAGVRPQ